MRLTDLDPKLWAAAGRHGQGVVFLCPHCRVTYLCVAFANPLDGGAPWNIGTHECRPIRQLWELLYGDLGDPAVRGAVLPKGTNVVPPGFLWQRTGETFEDLTLTPSVDASPAGCWHGFVTKGDAK